MAKIDANSTLKRLRNHYRLVVMNEDTYEEVVKFKLTRLSVYIAMSTIFVLMVGLTAALIIFTPLKYYLPGAGYGNAQQVKEYRDLKLRTDSMEQSLEHQRKYYEDLQKVLKGNISQLDTNKLALPKVESSDD
jgi:Mg2+ and Co2+ transporter CorA